MQQNSDVSGQVPLWQESPPCPAQMDLAFHSEPICPCLVCCKEPLDPAQTFLQQPLSLLQLRRDTVSTQSPAPGTYPLLYASTPLVLGPNLPHSLSPTLPSGTPELSSPNQPFFCPLFLRCSSSNPPCHHSQKSGADGTSCSLFQAPTSHLDRTLTALPTSLEHPTISSLLPLSSDSGPCGETPLPGSPRVSQAVPGTR